MIRIASAGLVVLLFGVIFARILGEYTELTALRSLAASYVTLVPTELTTANIVTGILITYRGFDTLGEVAVLYMVAASMGLLFASHAGHEAEQPLPRRNPSDIVRTSKQVLLPLVFAFGAYVILNGHLSAGGGFQGGAIVASGVMLMLLAGTNETLNTKLLSVGESMAGVFYILLGVMGLVFAGGFLDPRFLPAGELGAFVSAGAIPLISALLGIKVGAELSVIIDRFRS